MKTTLFCISFTLLATLVASDIDNGRNGNERLRKRQYGTCTGNKIPNCKEFGISICSNPTYITWVVTNCCMYCLTGGSNSGISTTTVTPTLPTCSDKLNNCAAYGKYACIGQYEAWAREKCAKYCGYCGSNSVSYQQVHTTQVSACIYKNNVYLEGQSWQDGCNFNCTCENGSTGFYRCTDLCPKYTNLPQGCSLVQKPGDCCSTPDCATGFCYYKDNKYSQDERWDDGCQYKCTCNDASTGQYTCSERCVTWQGLPSTCTMEPPAPGKCCRQPKCPSNVVLNYPPGYVVD